MANFQFDDDFQLPRGKKTRTLSNIDAIDLLKKIEAQEQVATESEQRKLAKYVGWGGIPEIFNPNPNFSWRLPAQRLKEVLTTEEYDKAFDSVLNAHFTDPLVIQEIYRGLEHLGFTGGKILEPAMGTGNFLGQMPFNLASRSEITGIELDSITGRIAKQLYPEAEIYVQGFEETVLPKDYFDLAIGNVPFGDYRIADQEYSDLNLRIHNYFFARSLDRVRPGGLLVFITSTGTMQSKTDKAFRVWMSERANLVGAMRLPGDAFKQTAGTEVTTDLLILQKLGPEVQSHHQNWIDLGDTRIQDAEGHYLQTNEYYARNPELMLGTLADDKLHPGRLALVSDDRDLPASMRQAFASFPANIYQKNFFVDFGGDESLKAKLPPDTDIKQYGYVAQGGLLWQRRGDWIHVVTLKGKTTERVLGMLEIRDAVQQVFKVQLDGGSDDALHQAQFELNEVYDKFVKRHGNLTATANIRAFKEDPDAQLLLALETINKKTKAVEKADVFSKRTVKPRLIRQSAESPQEALIASLNEYGSVVPGYMAGLLRQEETEVLADLSQQKLIFKNPISQQWETEDNYLSGDVRRKLAIAQNAAQESPEFQPNVEALEGIQPIDLAPGEIDVRLSSPWVPTEVIQGFAAELLDLKKDVEELSVSHDPIHAIWSVDYDPGLVSNSLNNTTHGTDNFNALDLIELSLNLKDATVFYTDAEGKRHVDTEPTLAARVKQQQLQQKFKSWIWQDFERSEKLCRLYNDTYNSTVVRHFRNPQLEMPGSNPEIELRPHQKDAVWRILQSDSTLLAHVVGAGKTFEMIAGALEMRRLNIARKPMIVVPNHMLGQFTRELYQLYPNAKILAPGEQETQASKRKKLMAKIATGDWDAVIVTHSAFTRLPVSKAEQYKYLKEQLAELNDAIANQDEGNGIVKELARQRRQLKERIERTTQVHKDDGVTFEQLGVDALFVDEAHFWKNLGRVSKLKNIAGLSNTNSQRAMDALIKTRLVRRAGGRLIFATGTPISNSIAEMYTMQRFLQPDSLQSQKIGNFDAWVGNFAETITAPEIDPTGRFKTKTRLTKFTNVPELMTLFREVTDIRTAQQLNLPRPEVERFTVAAGASPLQLRYMERLIQRAEAVQSRRVDPDQDNMLWVTTDGRRAALDPRLMDDSLPDYPESKVNQAIANIYAVWKATEQERSTQMVFCDLGIPKKGKADERPPFSIYDHFRQKLIERGVPPEEISFIHDAPKSKDKEILYAALRQGEKRILIGSTEKCGVGMNIQERLIAEHHIDPPWRPSDIEQREGRILRQGNVNRKVMLFTYVTQGRDGQLGFDSYSWQTLARKAEMVNQVMNGESAARSVDDISTSALSFDEVKAIATGNPLIMEKADVDNRVSELSRYKQAHINERYSVQQKLKRLPDRIWAYKQSIAAYRQDIERRQDMSGKNFRMQIGSTIFDRRTEAGEKLLAYRQKVISLKKKKTHQNDPQFSGSQVLGHFAGFKLVAVSFSDRVAFKLESPSGKNYHVTGGNTPLGVIRSIESTLGSIEEELDLNLKYLARDEASLESLSTQKDTPFEYEDELAEQLSRQFEINKELGLYKDDEQVAAEDDEQSQDQEEDNSELVDLDSLDTSDNSFDWLREEDEPWNDIQCPPTQELTEALTRIDEFLPLVAQQQEAISVDAQEVIEDPAPLSVNESKQIERDSIEQASIAAPISPQEIADCPPQFKPDEAILDSLRSWYFYAEKLERNYVPNIKEVAIAYKEGGTPISEKALTVMAQDKEDYQTSVTQLLKDSRAILKAVGESSTGNTVYSGKVYTISETPKGDLSVVSQDRGVICTFEENKLTTVNLSKQDFDIFQAFRSRVQSVTKKFSNAKNTIK